LTHDTSGDAALRATARDLYDFAGTQLPYLRADWFITTATQPPLYHTLLQLPTNVRQLEQQLKVDVDANFLNNELARAGFAKSGVSRQNRMVERHRGLFGAYWKSYDFKTNAGAGNLFKFPLGPVFKDNPFPRQAFEHAGGEIIFNLPNGMQGYLLIDNKGNRIDEGPTDIVSDSKETAGKVAVVNGISCMHCHQNGMIRDFKDTVRNSRAVSGEAQEKVERLYLEPAEMEKLLAKDEERFLRALGEATSGFLKGEKEVAKAPEPIYVVAVKYLKEDIGLDKAAYELGISVPKELQTAIKYNEELRKLGLGPLAEGDTIKRETWESLKDRFSSQFQQAAEKLDLGTPFRVRK
jgi:serine/threonine-protein kinase